MNKLVLFGDSLLANVSKNEVLIFESKFAHYDVYNCAVGGWDTNDCVKKATYIAKLQPDLIIMSVGTNDASPWKAVDIQTYTENLRKLFNIFANSKILFFLPPAINESILANHPKHKALTNVLLKEYNDKGKQVCLEANVAYFDSWKILKPLLDEGKDYHSEDGVHFSDYGYEVIISELSKVHVL